jgi:hypothetical protein
MGLSPTTFHHCNVFGLNLPTMVEQTEKIVGQNTHQTKEAKTAVFSMFYGIIRLIMRNPENVGQPQDQPQRVEGSLTRRQIIRGGVLSAVGLGISVASLKFDDILQKRMVEQSERAAREVKAEGTLRPAEEFEKAHNQRVSELRAEEGPSNATLVATKTGKAAGAVTLLAGLFDALLPR